MRALDSGVALEVLSDGLRRAEWPQADAVLRQAGPAVWPELTDLVVGGADDSAQRAGAVLGFPRVTDEVRLQVAHLRDEDPDARRLSAEVLGHRGGDAALPYARVLATMFDDPYPGVVAAAVGAFADIGRAAVPILREVRRSARRSRRAALAALVEIGWDTLDPIDARVAARLVAAKIRAEIAQPFYPNGEWYALRTDDRDAVLRAFGLSDPVPITMRAGFERWQFRPTPGSWLIDHFSGHRRCAQMFVSPVLDGWTLVFGTPKSMIRKHDETSIEDEHVAQQRRCVELSRQFGTVYWYVQVENGGCGDWMGWCSAEQESLIRYYHHDFHEGEVEAGEPLAAEANLHTPDGSGLLGRIQQHLPQEQAMYLLLTMPEYDPDAEGENSSEEALAALGEWREEVRAHLADVGVELLPGRSAAIIAERTTVGLGRLGPHTSVQGHGVLALTDCGRQWGHRGAFPL